MKGHHSRIIKPTRREALLASGAAFCSFAVGPDFAGATECILTSTQIDGPYHLRDPEDRRDVRSSSPES